MSEADRLYFCMRYRVLLQLRTRRKGVQGMLAGMKRNIDHIIINIPWHFSRASMHRRHHVQKVFTIVIIILS